jgi:hypothetical protein
LDFSSDFFDLFWSRFYETVSAEIHEWNTNWSNWSL